MKNVFLLILLSVVTLACTPVDNFDEDQAINKIDTVMASYELIDNDSEGLDGSIFVDLYYENGKNLISFNANGDSIIINTKNIKYSWMLSNFYFYKEIDFSSDSRFDSYSCTLEEHNKSLVGIEIKYKWLIVYAASNDKMIKIKVEENNTGELRCWQIILDSGLFWFRINCEQPSL